MTNAMTLVARPGALTASIVAETRAALNAAGARSAETVWLSADRAADIIFDGITCEDAEKAAVEALGDQPVDRVSLPLEGRRKKLLVADMDSTILVNETLDEIAASVGIGEQVAEITARSMRGELNFEESLRERVALLAGRDASIIENVLESISLSPGAACFIATMGQAGATTALVSGGFTMFTDRVKGWLGFDIAVANNFEIIDGQLTGGLDGPIIGRETKLDMLNSLAEKSGLNLSEALTIGDGANDLAMIEAAGLGIAYLGKPVLRERARARIDHTDLRTALYFQGFSDDEIVESNA